MFVPRDENDVPALVATSSSSSTTPIAVWVDPTTHRLLVDASVTVGAVSGSRTSNTAVPGATNIGALVGIATVAAPSYTEGYLVGLSTDLSGALRVTGSLSVGGTTDNSAFTAGTSTGSVSMGFYHATIDTVTDGRAAAVAITSKRAQHTSLYTPLGDSAMDDTNDAVKTTVLVSALPTGAATLAEQQTQTASLSVLDDWDESDRAKVNLIVGQAGIAAGTGVDGATVPRVTLATNVPLPAGTNAIGKLTSNSGVVIGSVEIAAAQTLATVTTVGTVTLVSTVTTVSTVSAVTAVGTITPGTAASSLGKAEDAAHASGDVGVMALAVANEAQSSFAADGDYIPQATDVKGNTMAVGNIAHDAADAGNPVKVGGKAVSAEPTAVTANDRANFITDLVGKLITLPYANPENFVSGAITSAMTGTTSTSLIAAPAAGLRNYITTIIVSNAHATVGTDIIIQDGSGGTTLMTIPAAAVYGGAVITLPVPLRQPTTATAIYCANVTTGASTKVSAVGYKGV